MDNPNDVSYSSKSQPTIFHELLCSDLPAEEKSFDRLCTEGITIVSAGAETTAATLGVITFFVLNNPEILKKLKKELEVAMPDLEKPVKWRELEQLPYLVCSRSLRVTWDIGLTDNDQTAVISEGLRYVRNRVLYSVTANVAL
jgi:cytochrome P450